MKFTRQGVRDLSAMGPKNPERNRRIEEIPKQAPMASDTWFNSLTMAMAERRDRRMRPIFGDPTLGDE